MIASWPRPPRTASNSSRRRRGEQVTRRPLTRHHLELEHVVDLKPVVLGGAADAADRERAADRELDEVGEDWGREPSLERRSQQIEPAHTGADARPLRADALDPVQGAPLRAPQDRRRAHRRARARSLRPRAPEPPRARCREPGRRRPRPLPPPQPAIAASRAVARHRTWTSRRALPAGAVPLRASPWSPPSRVRGPTFHAHRRASTREI